MSCKKRKSLSDLTNAPYDNLIPASTLRKLVYNPKAASSSAQGPKPGPGRSSGSVTTVGSTNVVARNPEDSTGNQRRKNAEHARRQKREKSNKENESPDVNAAKKRDDKGKAIVEALGSTPEKVKWKQRETCDPCKLILDPFNVGVKSIQERLFADLAINRASSSKKPVVTKNDDVVVYSCPGKARTTNKKSKQEAASATLLKSWTEPRPNRGKENEFSDMIAAKKRDNKGKVIVESLSSPPEKVKWKQRETHDPCKVILDHFNNKVTTIQEGLSADLAINLASLSKKPVMTKSNDVVAYSCPAKAKTRNKKSKKEAASVTPGVKSWTEPRPTRKKKNYANCSDELPRDFIEQQRAYFKEVDEFELLEEEVSEDELD